MPFMGSPPPREARKRREHELSLSPRPAVRTPAAQERLPSIHSLLPESIPPPRNDASLSQQLQHNPTGPSHSVNLPARLSPPSVASRNQSSPGSTNGAARSSHQVEDRGSRRSSTHDGVSSHQLPFHSGPPSRTGFSHAALSAESSPYPMTQTDTRRHINGDSSSLPPPPAPYHNGASGHSPSYGSSRDQRNESRGSDTHYYQDSWNSTPRNGADRPYYTSQSAYNSTPYGYHQHPHTNGGYPNHSYPNRYSRGATQFEAEDGGAQAQRRRRGNLPRDTTNILKQWFQDHLAHPYPTEEEKQTLCTRTGLQMTQISNWFINARRRRIPALMNQAEAETRLRENSGDSANSSE